MFDWRMIDMKQQKRQYAIGKCIVGCLLFILVSTQLGWIYREEPEYITIRVQAGDTLWKLASATVDTDTDIRYTIHTIIKENHLVGNEDIYPGQVLQIPVKKSYTAQAKFNLQERVIFGKISDK